MKRIKRSLKNLFLGTAGAAAVVFGVTVPVVVTATGFTVDMSQAFVMRERLSRALDAAALAAASMQSDDETEIESRVDRFLNANYPSGVIGERIDMSIDLDTENDTLHVTARARLDTSFMHIIGKPYVYVDAETTVKREVRGLEVVMVLDNTGSMNSNNNIGALKTASTNFINILFDAVSTPEHVRIGMVPYSSSVNVGNYGLGLDEDGNPLSTAGFVEPPSDDVYYDYTHADFYTEWEYGIAETDLVYNPAQKGQWHGCVLAADYPLDTEDHPGPWKMYRYDYEGSTNSYYQQDWKYLNGQWFSQGDRYNSNYGPNYHCPDQRIIPLTSDQATLSAAINNMHADGFTLGNFGMVWGWRVISPDFPFTEGADYDDPVWEKAVLMMTDGDNTMNHAYTAYGKTREHSIGPYEENQRFLEVCNNMKAEGVLIYTVTFYSGISEATKDYYRQCATDESKYFDAPSQDDLQQVFERIARELSNLHITQ